MASFPEDLGVFEAGRARWKPWVPDLYARRVDILDDRHGRFVMGYRPAHHERIEPGEAVFHTDKRLQAFANRIVLDFCRPCS